MIIPLMLRKKLMEKMCSNCVMLAKVQFLKNQVFLTFRKFTSMINSFVSTFEKESFSHISLVFISKLRRNLTDEAG